MVWYKYGYKYKTQNIKRCTIVSSKKLHTSAYVLFRQSDTKSDKCSLKIPEIHFLNLKLCCFRKAAYIQICIYLLLRQSGLIQNTNTNTKGAHHIFRKVAHNCNLYMLLVCYKIWRIQFTKSEKYSFLNLKLFCFRKAAYLHLHICF